ncbi:MAG: 3-hydroxyacyl-CoA dehydrogenase [Candidatus Aminicenantes bacterium]|nr:3-hydroxyacyl-CoA dehydrogenase [Candidatus Aminicenantes bacterium]
MMKSEVNKYKADNSAEIPDSGLAEILVVGPGKMGTGLSLAFAQSGFSVLLVGRSQVSLESGLNLIDESLKEGINKGVFDVEEAQKIRQRISLKKKENNFTFPEVKSIKLALEAISEDFKAKAEVLAELDSSLPLSTPLATITSSLDAELLGSTLAHPEKFIWLHFFYPPQKNRAVEVAHLSRTSLQTIEITMAILGQAGREIIRLKKYRRGGVANIILISLILEALRLIDEGFEVSLVEEASRLAFNLPMGFLSLLSWLDQKLALTVASSLRPTGDSKDPIFLAYDNFFTWPARLQEFVKKEGVRGLDSFLKINQPHKSENSSLNALILELAQQRFLAVAFMTSSEVVEAGLIDPASCDRLCQLALGWPEGPFTLMNRLGIEAALRLVTERMELSHRQEINFPVPRNLIEKAMKKELWPLT